MYKRIFELTEEIERVISTDGSGRLQDLLARRAEAFAAMEAQAPEASGEAMRVIKEIQKCERRCQEQAIRKMAALKQDMDGIRKTKRLKKAYGRFVSTV